MRTIHCNGRVYAPTKVICVGKNFPSHIAETASHPADEPVIFIKPNSAVSSREVDVCVPEALGLVHHEVELCFVVGKRVRNVSVEGALSCIQGYAVGLDLTLREMQSKAKSQGLPWALAKGFDNAAVLGDFLEAQAIDNPQALNLHLSVNGIERQRASTAEMIFSPAEILAFASRYMTIEPGDVFMCGTPAGVGELSHDDVVVARIEGLPVLEVTIKRT